MFQDSAFIRSPPSRHTQPDHQNPESRRVRGNRNANQQNRPIRSLGNRKIDRPGVLARTLGLPFPPIPRRSPFSYGLRITSIARRGNFLIKWFWGFDLQKAILLKLATNKCLILFILVLNASQLFSLIHLYRLFWCCFLWKCFSSFKLATTL